MRFNSTRFSRWLARRLFERFQRRVVLVRPPDFVIGADSADPYMRRWFVIPRNRFLNVYLHHVCRDDEDRALHDHPWPSVSLCLDGVVGEVFLHPEGFKESRLNICGDLVYRSARFAHRLYLPDGPAWTIFITGPRIREWGFWCPKESAAGGWRSWREFTAFRDVGEDGKGKIGRGCD